MKKKRAVFGIVLIFLIFFFFYLILLLLYLQQGLKEGKTLDEIISYEETKSEFEEIPVTIESVLESYQTKIINKINTEIYVTFSKDLYSENGNSNRLYFENIVEDLKQFFEVHNFYLIDEEKKITISAKYNEEIKDYEIIINNLNTIDEFYSKTEGSSYMAVDDSKIVTGTNMSTDNIYLSTLQMNGLFKSIENYLGEGTELDDGYISYLDGLIKLRTVPTGAVRNLIFTENYNGGITKRIYAGMTLEEILEKEPNYDFGGIEKGYLGYRQLNYYLFFYDDEISAYTYSYKENTKFEEILKEYIETENLDRFVNKLSRYWNSYDYLEYDQEQKNAKILYSARGIEIDIKNNDTSGITLYTNYYFTDLTKSYVKNGIVKFNEKTDLIHKIEKERRND